jgi:hypothetical protein
LTPHNSYQAEHFSLEIRADRDIFPGDPIIPLPAGVDSLLIRSPGSQTEAGDYSKDKNECLSILNNGKNVLSVLNSRGKSLYSGTKYEKKLENGGCTNHLCVIIIFRGEYAPG